VVVKLEDSQPRANETEKTQQVEKEKNGQMENASTAV